VLTLEKRESCGFFRAPPPQKKQGRETGVEGYRFDLGGVESGREGQHRLPPDLNNESKLVFNLNNEYNSNTKYKLDFRCLRGGLQYPATVNYGVTGTRCRAKREQLKGLKLFHLKAEATIWP